MAFFLLFFLPKIITISILFFEILYFGQIYYFYKSLWLLLITLFARIIRYFCKQFTEHALKIFDDYLIIKHIPMQKALYQMLFVAKEKNNMTYKYFYDIQTNIYYIYQEKPHTKKINKNVDELFFDYLHFFYNKKYWLLFYTQDQTYESIVLTLYYTIFAVYCWFFVFFNMCLFLKPFF